MIAMKAVTTILYTILSSHCALMYVYVIGKYVLNFLW